MLDPFTEMLDPFTGAPQTHPEILDPCEPQWKSNMTVAVGRHCISLHLQSKLTGKVGRDYFNLQFLLYQMQINAYFFCQMRILFLCCQMHIFFAKCIFFSFSVKCTFFSVRCIFFSIGDQHENASRYYQEKMLAAGTSRLA